MRDTLRDSQMKVLRTLLSAPVDKLRHYRDGNRGERSDHTKSGHGGGVRSTLLIDPLISAALEGDQLLGFKPQSDLFTGTFHRVAAMDDVPV